MRPGDLTSSSSSAAWLVLLRAAATPAARRAGLLPGQASRNGLMTSAPPVAAFGVTPGVARLTWLAGSVVGRKADAPTVTSGAGC